MTLNRKIAYIDLTSGHVETTPVSSDLRSKYIGGRGINNHLLSENLKAGSDALGPNNVIVIGAGLLAGTPASAASPLHICTRSPITGYYAGYHGSNLFSAELRWAGFDHVVIKGKSAKPVYIAIENGKITLRDASNLAGKDIIETQDFIREDLRDSGIAVLAIGPAGEKLVAFAGVFGSPDDTDCGAGIGAVMGSKNLKAVAVRGTTELTMDKPRELLDYSFELAAAVKACQEQQTSRDTSIFMPRSIKDYNDMMEILTENNIMALKGLDPVETMNVIAWAIELYDEDIITDEDLNGLQLTWNSPKAVKQLVEDIATRKGIGNTLAENSLKAAEIFGKDAEQFLLHVKGKCVPADITLTPASALSIITSSGGTEYSKNRPDTELFDLPESVLKYVYGQPVPYDGTLSADESEYTGKAWQTVWRENCCMAADCLGVNGYSGVIENHVYPSYEVWSKMIAMATGLNIAPKDIWEAAERAVNIERMLSIREGLTCNEEKLPESYYRKESATPSPGISIKADKLDALLKEYYTLHGWNEDGVPKG